MQKVHVPQSRKFKKLVNLIKSVLIFSITTFIIFFLFIQNGLLANLTGIHKPTLTPFPTYVPIATDSPLPTSEPSQAYQQQASQAADTIDCIGPDGKHLRLSKTQCDIFNAAWSKPQATDGNVNQNAQQSSGTAIQQATTINQIEGSYNTCANGVQQQYNNCMNTCRNNYSNGNTACSWEWTGGDPNTQPDSSKYSQCIDEALSIDSKCQDQCVNADQSGLSSCNNSH